MFTKFHLLSEHRVVKESIHMDNNGIFHEKYEINAILRVDDNCKNGQFPKMVEILVDCDGE